MSTLARQLIAHLPKTELHLHIEGTLEPAMLLQLAQRNRITLPYSDVGAVQAAYEFDCLQDFLDLYYLGMSVLMHEQDFYDLTWAYLERVAADSVHHVEIFFDPQAHMARGIAFETVLAGITRALAEGREAFGISSRLIMCFLRHLPEEQAFDVLEQACRYKEHIFGVGLDSSERDFPPANFSRVYARARQEGFVPVAHAGEEGPAAYVQSALDDLQVRRIDHGNHALDDAALTARLVREQIPLTMCPLSNLRLKVISDMRQNPVKRALALGLLVTVNSDDPSYFGGYVNDNYRALHEALGLSERELVTLAQNSFRAAFLDDSARQAGLDAIAACAGKLGA
ncbi:MAG: adenosine deaminase [Thiothrix sp.]|nr:adenosine deaminase [Thiothrix sp.]HPQ95739.1 adenosine deaminase [Thiolinea sp.]